MIGRALRAEAVRLRSDVLLAVGAVLAVALAASITFSLPEDLGAAPESARLALFAALEPSILVNAAAIAGLYGSFRYTSELERGVVARQLGFVGRLPLLGARATRATLGGSILAAVAALAAAAAFSVRSGVAAGDGRFALAAVAIGCCAGFWGLAAGVVIRRHRLALFVVPTILVSALPLAAWRPEARLATPLGAWLAVVERDGGAGVEQSAALAAGAAWLAGTAAVAALITLRRDVA